MSILSERTRVVVLLAAPAAHISFYYSSREVAQEFIQAWAKRQSDRIANGQGTEVEINLYTGCGPEGDAIESAMMGQYIIGMYIASSDLTAQERIAVAVEKQLGEGEGWRG